MANDAKNCREMITNLNDFIDGDLAPELCLEIKQHLGNCQNCRLMVDSLKQTVKLSCDGKDMPIPQELELRLNDLLKARWAKKFGSQS